VKQNIIIISVTFIATVLMVAMSGQITQYETKDIVLVITSFISILAIILGFMSFFRTERNLLIVTENIGKLEAIRISYHKMIPRNSLSWLYSDRQLRNIEKKKKNSKEIWIVSPDPSDDTGDSPWKKVIKDNLEDGMIYYYFSPDSETLAGAIKGLKTVFRNNLDKCFVYKLESADYERLPYGHMVIYDPHNEHNETDSYAEIETNEKGWWVKLTHSRKNALLGKLFPFIEEAKTLNEY
jgi:hypothetical protein